MKTFLVGILLWLMLACTPTPTQAQQTPRPTVNLYELHYVNHNGTWLQVKTFEHDGNVCYISTEKITGNQGLSGGISCVRK